MVLKRKTVNYFHHKVPSPNQEKSILFEIAQLNILEGKKIITKMLMLRIILPRPLSLQSCMNPFPGQSRLIQPIIKAMNLFKIHSWFFITLSTDID